LDANDGAFMIDPNGALVTFPSTIPGFQPSDVSWATITGHGPITLHGRDSSGAVIGTWRNGAWHAIFANQFLATAIPSPTGVIVSAFTGVPDKCDVLTGPDTGPLTTTIEDITCPKQQWLSPTNKLWSISPSKIDDLSTGSVYPVTKGLGI